MKNHQNRDFPGFFHSNPKAKKERTQKIRTDTPCGLALKISSLGERRKNLPLNPSHKKTARRERKRR
jgi:hypothetical protein